MLDVNRYDKKVKSVFWPRAIRLELRTNQLEAGSSVASLAREAR